MKKILFLVCALALYAFPAFAAQSGAWSDA